MKSRQLGTSGLEVSAIGLCCMAMTDIYDPSGNQESSATVRHAVDIGVTFIDTSDMYGSGRNEELVDRALQGIWNRAVIATKFGNPRLPDGQAGVNGRTSTGSIAAGTRHPEAQMKRAGL